MPRVTMDNIKELSNDDLLIEYNKLHDEVSLVYIASTDNLHSVQLLEELVRELTLREGK